MRPTIVVDREMTDETDTGSGGFGGFGGFVQPTENARLKEYKGRPRDQCQLAPSVLISTTSRAQTAACLLSPTK